MTIVQAAVCLLSLSLRSSEQATTTSQTWGETRILVEERSLYCIVVPSVVFALSKESIEGSFKGVLFGCSKTRGLGAGRKLRNHRRKQLWADKDYKKSHLGNEWKKPFAGASHAKGIVLEKM